MEEINDRVKQIRTYFGLSQDAFGALLGIKKAAVSLIENKKSGLTEQNILAICRELNIREEWLREGQGEMLYETEKFSLDTLVKENCTDETEAAAIVEILKLYFGLDPDIRRRIVAHFKAQQESRTRPPLQPKKDIKDLMQKPPAEMTEEEIQLLEQEFDRELREEKEAGGNVQAFSDSTGSSGEKMA